MRFSKDGELLLVQTRETQLVVLSVTRNNAPRKICAIENIPGDLVIDFKFSGATRVVCLTKDGHLSSHEFQDSKSVLLETIKLVLKPNEAPNGLEVSQVGSFVCVASLEFEKSN